MATYIDPLALSAELWPQTRFYRKQREIIRSVEESVETYVVAGNKLGKDFVAGFICIATFLRALKYGCTCRVVTTSVKEEHLMILWGEIARFVMTCRVPLLARDGGPLVMQHMEIRRREEAEAKNPFNYLKGMVSAEVEGMSGHHADMTLFVGDEASGLENKYYIAAQGWAKRILLFGNPNPTSNQFRAGCEAGDLEVSDEAIVVGVA